MLQEVISAYGSHPDQMKLLSIIPYAGGFVTWIYYLLLPVKEGKLPIPFWLITMWFAHDFSGAFIFRDAAQAHNNFWFFASTSTALFVWTTIEIVGMILVIAFARQDVWGRYSAKPVTVASATFYTIAELALMMAVVHLLRLLMSDVIMMKWFILTNIVLAVGPWFLIRERQSREGSSILLSLIWVVVVAQTFAPPGYGMFTTISAEFDKPWFYAAGLIFTAFAVWNTVNLILMPAKARVPGKWNIW